MTCHCAACDGMLPVPTLDDTQFVNTRLKIDCHFNGSFETQHSYAKMESSELIRLKCSTYIQSKRAGCSTGGVRRI